MSNRRLKVVVVGLGYFSRFHLAAWQSNDRVEIVGVCDADLDRLSIVRTELGIAGSQDINQLLNQVSVDIIDVVTPPDAHNVVVRAALEKTRTVICQKPFCQSLVEADALITDAEAAGTQIFIHENFRFQPWRREIRDFLDSGRMGQVYQARFSLRPGDGRGPNAYQDRQPAFRTMPRLLLHETGIHFIDLFRWLLGEIESVYAEIQQLNPAIVGEDTATMILNHEGGIRSIFDGNRLSDHVASDLRYTMGELQIEGEGGRLSLNGSGELSFRPFGIMQEEQIHINRQIDESSFGGGCVAALIDHVVDSLLSGQPPENPARDYLQVMAIKEAAYHSATEKRQIKIEKAFN